MLAHVAQQRQGGSTARASVESAAHGAARTVAQGGSVPSQSLGGAADGGLYCDDDEKAPPAAGVPGPLIPYRDGFGPQPTPPWLMPPLLTEPKIDWLSMRSSFGARGMPFTTRDAGDITAEWMRSKALLNTLGINEQFKFWFMDQDWLLNTALKFQLDTVNARDNPNAMDLMNKEWDIAKYGMDEKRIPPIPFFTKKF
jgi:hypothetical protein